MFKMDFISACIRGKSYTSKIDSYIEAWHKGKAGTDKKLHEFLGMTEKEYSLWVEKPEFLSAIIYAHTQNIEVAEVWNRGESIAARASSEKEAEQLHKWLCENQRISS